MVLAFGPPKFDRDISPVDITAFAETLTEGFQPAGERSGRLGTKISDHRHIAGCWPRTATGHAAAPPRAAMNSRRFICWTDIQTPQGGGLAHTGILTCPTRSGAASGAPDARVGSKAEELALSICCPLSLRKRTSLGRFATSALCQYATSIDQLIGAHQQRGRHVNT